MRPRHREGDHGFSSNVTGIHMKCFLLPIAASLFVAPVAPVCLAEGIYKCTSEAGVSYQSAPCASGVTKVLIVLPSDKGESRPGVDGPTAFVSSMPLGPTAIHTNDDGLQPGMSDLQVLNNRRWGKPQRITRNRDARAWHEHWNYEAGPNGGKRLHFVNGKLADVAALESPLAGAALMSAAMMVGR